MIEKRNSVGFLLVSLKIPLCIGKEWKECLFGIFSCYMIVELESV